MCYLRTDRSACPLTDAGFARVASVTYDPAGSVTAHLGLPWLARTAVFRPTLGCTLVDFDARIPIHPAPAQIPLPENQDPDLVDWPMGDRLNPAEIQAARAQIKGIEGIEQRARDLRDAFNIRGLLVLYKGQIVMEQYAQGWE